MKAGFRYMQLSLAVGTFVCLVGCALTSAVMGQTGSIRVMYYAPAWGPNTNGEEIAYFLKQVTYEAPRTHENRIYLCSIKPDGSQRVEIAQLWKDQPDQWIEPYATAATMEINAATKRAAIGVEQGQRSGVFIVNQDGKGFQVLWPKEWSGDRPTTAGYPTWSPDGKWIAFHEHRFEKGNDYFRIAKMRPDATEYTPLTERDSFNKQPTWSPKSDAIAYVSDQISNRARNIHAVNLWLMNSDGSEKRDTRQWGRYPRWSPDGRTILLEGAILVDSVSGKKIKGWDGSWIYPKWGNGGFLSVGPLDIGITDSSGKTSRQLLKNVSYLGGHSNFDEETFRW